MINIRYLFFILFIASACTNKSPVDETGKNSASSISLIVLGNVQDAGSPQIACKKDCCKGLFSNPDPTRKVVSLGVIDRENNKSYLFDASPDMVSQLRDLKNAGGNDFSELPEAIFITHAHIGHYTGLMYLGKEAINAKKQKVYTMPQMSNFLSNSGPWSQLVINENIALQALNDSDTVVLSDKLSVIPFRVPHRDEYSETVGFKIIGPNKSSLFIPDIDKWQKWDRDIIEEIAAVDHAFVDGTFYDGVEINNRDISEIPHPFIIESMDLFDGLDIIEKQKINFIHFNHTNPLLNKSSSQSQEVLNNNFNIARYLEVFDL